MLAHTQEIDAYGRPTLVSDAYITIQIIFINHRIRLKLLKSDSIDSLLAKVSPPLPDADFDSWSTFSKFSSSPKNSVCSSGSELVSTNLSKTGMNYCRGLFTTCTIGSRYVMFEM